MANEVHEPPTVRIAPNAEVDPGASIGAGTAIWGLTAVREGAVLGTDCIVGRGAYIEDGVVRQKNFPDLPPLTLAQTPVIETHLVASTRPPSGVGEPGLPPVAPALANALFVLTGRRLRELPLSLSSSSRET